MMSARPPNAAAGRPPPMTLPYVHRSASEASRPCHPARETRNPVITSSTTSRAPCACAIRASCWLKPSRGATTPMLPAAASVITAAMCGPSAANASSTARMSLYGQHDRLAGRRAGHAGRVGQAQGGHAGAGGGEQRVDVPVVAAGELDDLRAAGEATGQPDRRHGGLGAGVDQADLLDRGAVDDLGGQLHLTRGGRAEAGAPGGGGLHGLHHLRVGVPEDQRTPGADQVDVAAAVGVVQPRALATDHETRRAADRLEGAHRGVHPARHDGAGAVEQGLGGRRVGRVAAGSGWKDVGHDAAIVSATDGRPAATPRWGYQAHLWPAPVSSVDMRGLGLDGDGSRPRQAGSVGSR